MHSKKSISWIYYCQAPHSSVWSVFVICKNKCCSSFYRKYSLCGTKYRSQSSRPWRLKMYSNTCPLNTSRFHCRTLRHPIHLYFSWKIYEWLRHWFPILICLTLDHWMLQKSSLLTLLARARWMKIWTIAVRLECPFTVTSYSCCPGMPSSSNNLCQYKRISWGLNSG